MNNPEAVKAKAERYQRWAEDDGLNEAIERIKQGYIKALIYSDSTDIQGRENCYIAVNLIEKIEGHIRSVIGGGKMADKEIAKIERETKKKKFKII